MIEIIPVAISSKVTLEYILNAESRQRLIFGQHESTTVIPFIKRPSPELMLVSCLVLGLSVSSFAYRRQEHDPFQVIVLLFLLAGAVAVGIAAGATVNLILLGYVPWAICAAMMISYAGHSHLRWHQSRVAEKRRISEKSESLD